MTFKGSYASRPARRVFRNLGIHEKKLVFNEQEINLAAQAQFTDSEVRSELRRTYLRLRKTWNVVFAPERVIVPIIVNSMVAIAPVDALTRVMAFYSLKVAEDRTQVQSQNKPDLADKIDCCVTRHENHDERPRYDYASQLLGPVLLLKIAPKGLISRTIPNVILDMDKNLRVDHRECASSQPTQTFESRAILLARYRLLRSTKILPKAIRILSSGYNIYVSAEMAYSRGDIVSAFESYQKAIRKILKDENPTAKVPIPASRLPLLPPHQPLELLGAVWQNFVGFFRDPQMNFTEESAPEAYKLLASFRPNAGTSLKSHTRLERTERGKILLKGMQVTAALTLGLLAWDKKDRATAAKRYQEGIDLAKTVPDFMDPPKGMKGWEVYVNGDMKQVKENLGLIVKNDMVNAELIRTRSGVAYKVPEKTDAPLTEEEQIAQLDQVMQMSRLYPTADPWGMKVDTLGGFVAFFSLFIRAYVAHDVMLPYSTSLSTRSSYSSWGDMYSQFKENWLNRGKNYTSMVMLATENAIPGVDLSSARWWQKYFTQWPWRLGSTTSIKEDSWLTSLREGALSSYCQLNTALANGDDQAIKRLTTHTYQDHMLKLRKKQQQRSKYLWHFHKEVSPARVLSIRANQGYLATDEPKFGNRMMVHALVRIDTEQVGFGGCLLYAFAMSVPPILLRFS
ncbi:hypothetical protein H0H93_014980 [Arthromyces matolae]|nr:hypothetical protein H0H93_014980 [Arthromyces matolae]